MLGAGAVLSTPTFAAGDDAGAKPKSGGVKRFEFGEDGCSKRGVFEKLMEPVMAEFKATGTPLCVAFGNHDSEQPESDKAFVWRKVQYAPFSAVERRTQLT